MAELTHTPSRAVRHFLRDSRPHLLHLIPLHVVGGLISSMQLMYISKLTTTHDYVVAKQTTLAFTHM